MGRKMREEGKRMDERINARKIKEEWLWIVIKIKNNWII